MNQKFLIQSPTYPELVGSSVGTSVLLLFNKEIKPLWEKILVPGIMFL